MGPLSAVKSVIFFLLTCTLVLLGAVRLHQYIIRDPTDLMSGLTDQPQSIASSQDPSVDKIPVLPILPKHFPLSAESTPIRVRDGSQSLQSAISHCWPNRTAELKSVEKSVEGKFSVADLEMLFGKIKRREPIVQGQKDLASFGVIFDNSIWPSGAAAQITELKTAENETHISSFKTRVGGRLLQCHDLNHCECI